MNCVFDFDKFERDFHAAAAESLRLLSEQYSVLPYYAVCVYVDSFDGEFALYANTETYFEKILQFYQSKFPGRCLNPEAIKSIKYNCGNFEYQTIGRPKDFRASFERTMKPWSTLVYDISYNRGGLTSEDYRHFDESACRVAKSIASSAELALLNRSDDFLMLVASADEPPIAAIYRLKWFEEYGSLNAFKPSNYAVIGETEV